MTFSFLKSNYPHELRAQLKELGRNHAQSLQDKEMRASSSLYELSENICFQQHKNQTLVGFRKRRQTRNEDIGLSPWVNRFASHSKIQKQQNSRPFIRKYSTGYKLERGQVKKCCTENNENTLKMHQNNPNEKKLLMKINSIFQKKTQPKESKKPISNQERPETQYIILMCKRKKYSLDTNTANSIMKKKVNQTQPLINKAFTSKILNMNLIDQAKQTSTDKKITQGWYQETNKWKNPVALINDHWKAKSLNPKNIKGKKISSNGKRSKETKEVRQNLCCQSKFQVAQIARKEECKSNNPLAQLLYDKYLYTIGVNQSSKELNVKYL